jgi:XapX domain-containing protein
MTGYLFSLLMGMVVGVAYGLVQVRSPAPPLIALVGLLGILLGEQTVDLAKRYLSPVQSDALLDEQSRREGDAIRVYGANRPNPDLPLSAVRDVQQS